MSHRSLYCECSYSFCHGVVLVCKQVKVQVCAWFVFIILTILFFSPKIPQIPKKDLNCDADQIVIY